MTYLQEFAGQELRWMRPHLFQNTYELRAGEQILATFQRGGLFKGSDLASVGDQQLILRREGAFRNGLLKIYPAGEQESQPLASIRRRMNGSAELTLSDDRIYTWHREGHWRPTLFWTGPDGARMLTLKNGRLVTIEPAASGAAELPLLLVAAIYLRLLAEAIASASSAGA
jgi:hypothetical protein